MTTKIPSYCFSDLEFKNVDRNYPLISDLTNGENRVRTYKISTSPHRNTHIIITHTENIGITKVEYTN